MVRLIVLASILLTYHHNCLILADQHHSGSESYVTLITKLIPQNLAATATRLSNHEAAHQVRGGRSYADGHVKNFPAIFLEHHHPSSSWNLRAKCVGDGVTSLSAIQCDSPADCERQLICLNLDLSDQDHGQHNSCPRDKLIYRGKPCLASKIAPGSPHSCFQLDDRRWQLTSGLIQCTTGAGVPGSNFRRNIQKFFKGTDHLFHLVRAPGKSVQVDIQVREDDSIGQEIEYVGRPVFYTNKKLRISCRATKFLFRDIKLSVLKADGSTYEISSGTNSSSFQFVQNNGDKYWTEFHLQASSRALELTTGLVGLVCAAQSRDSLTDWTESVFNFTVSEPSQPVIDKSKKTRASQENGSKIACSYTGGPATVQIIREADGMDVIDPMLITSDGEMREQRSKLKEYENGNFTCIVTNSMGTDSFHFYQEFPKTSLPYQADSQNGGSSLKHTRIFLLLAYTIIFIISF